MNEPEIDYCRECGTVLGPDERALCADCVEYGESILRVQNNRREHALLLERQDGLGALARALEDLP